MGKQILVVDDDPVNRRLLQIVFERAGWQVVTRADAASARREQLDRRFDIVLTDLHMPGESGCELVHWTAEHCPETSTALMSTDDDGCGECPMLRRCPFLHKPFAVHRVLSFVDTLRPAASA
jgi:DNA-binding NtrC family response regulator